MRNDIQKSYIPVPVPTELYVSLLDRLNRLHSGYEPKTMVTSILQKYLDEAQVNPPRQSGMEPALDWSNDWIMFESPPPLTKEKAPRTKKKSKRPSSTDWCIGCGCPSEDLLSS